MSSGSHPLAVAIWYKPSEGTPKSGKAGRVRSGDRTLSLAVWKLRSEVSWSLPASSEIQRIDMTL